jgi:hypothetical protein
VRAGSASCLSGDEVLMRKIMKIINSETPV